MVRAHSVIAGVRGGIRAFFRPRRSRAVRSEPESDPEQAIVRLRPATIKLAPSRGLDIRASLILRRRYHELTTRPASFSPDSSSAVFLGAAHGPDPGPTARRRDDVAASEKGIELKERAADLSAEALQRVHTLEEKGVSALGRAKEPLPGGHPGRQRGGNQKEGRAPHLSGGHEKAHRRPSW